MERRNILFIIIDQLRADCLHGALADHVDLPNIRRFRDEAVSFERHYSVTNPCGPSRASLFTGLYAMNHRSVRNGTPLAAHHTNVALEMRKAGYDPLLFGYTDTTHDPRTGHPRDPRLLSGEGVLPGFHEIVEMAMEQSYPWRAHLKKKGYDLPDYSRIWVPVSPDPTRPPRPDDPPFYRAEDSDTAFLTDAFLQQMAVRTDQDWFALLTYLRPHPPLVAPEPYNRLYDPSSLPLPVRRPDPAEEEAVHPYIAAHRRTPSLGDTVVGCGAGLDERRDEDVQLLRALYLGLATEVDHHLGRIMDFLRETGQYDETLIIVTADHGEMLGDHHMWGKQHVYEPAWHIPLLIRDPARPQGHGTRVQALTETIDIAPTILEACGRPVPAAMDGRPLCDFLEGRTPSNWKDAIMMELEFAEPDYPRPLQKALSLPLRDANFAILREERYKLVHFNAGLPPLVFDLQEDPGEMNDLAGDPAHRDTLLRLTQRLLSHRMSHADRNLSEMKATAGGVLNFTPEG